MKKLMVMISIVGSIISGQLSTVVAQDMQYSSINDDKNYIVQLELNKLPAGLVEDLNNMGIKIKVDKNFLEDTNFKSDGQYTWMSKVITLDDAQSSITHALYHEIGHALDGIFILREDENIIKSFNEGELYFGSNNYYNDDIKEYIAQGIYHYYSGNLCKDSTLYRVLDNYLDDYNQM